MTTLAVPWAIDRPVVSGCGGSWSAAGQRGARPMGAGEDLDVSSAAPQRGQTKWVVAAPACR